MAEHFLGQQYTQDMIRQQLAVYRQNPEHFVKQTHPQVIFITLEQLICEPAYASFIHQPLLRLALEMLPNYLSSLPGCHLFDPARVWIGIASPLDSGWFGGFYHTDQGYRYLQQIALTSLSGALSPYAVDGELRTLELLRSYVHDTPHSATYRLFCPIPPEGSSDLSFYRLQYGMNFRRFNGQSYSARDSVLSLTTHNLVNIMEAATDRFAQAFVLALARQIGYQPDPGTWIEECLFHDCIGQVTEQNLLFFRAIERGQAALDLPAAFKSYLRQMRLFIQYVTMRYSVFLTEYGDIQTDDLHTLILLAMMTGKLRKLQRFLNRVRREAKSFMTLFKTPAY